MTISSPPPPGSCVNSPGSAESRLLETACIGNPNITAAYPLCADMGYTSTTLLIHQLFCCVVKQQIDAGIFSLFLQSLNQLAAGTPGR